MLKQADAAGLSEAAHKLYGMVSAFSTAVGETVSKLEDLAAQGDLAAARSLVVRLLAEAEILLPQMNNLSLAGLRKQLELASAPSLPGRS